MNDDDDQDQITVKLNGVTFWTAHGIGNSSVHGIDIRTVEEKRIGRGSTFHIPMTRHQAWLLEGLLIRLANSTTGNHRICVLRDLKRLYADHGQPMPSFDLAGSH